MTFQKNFEDHSKQYIFFDDQFLSEQRDRIYNKIVLKKFDVRNNESLKNITLSDINSFNYYFQNSNDKPSVKLLEKNVYQINLINGKSISYEDDYIEIRNISKIDSDKLKNNYSNDQNDIILDMNTIFLNSGINVNVKQESKVKIKLYHTANKNFTIFQKKFFYFPKRL